MAVMLVGVFISVLVRMGLTSIAMGRSQVSCISRSRRRSGVFAVSDMVMNWFRARSCMGVCLSWNPW